MMYLCEYLIPFPPFPKAMPSQAPQTAPSPTAAARIMEVILCGSGAWGALEKNLDTVPSILAEDVLLAMRGGTRHLLYAAWASGFFRSLRLDMGKYILSQTLSSV